MMSGGSQLALSQTERDQFGAQIVVLDGAGALLQHRAADRVQAIFSREVDVGLVGNDEGFDRVTDCSWHCLGRARAGASSFICCSQPRLSASHPTAAAAGGVNDQRAPQIEGDGSQLGQW